MKDVVGLSMPVAFLIENCRTSGASDEVIVRCMRERDFSPILNDVVEPSMDFAERMAVAEEIGEPWEEAVRFGYRFKFLHFNGVKRLLRFRFGKQADRDYKPDGLQIEDLSLTAEEAETLRSLIRTQWDVVDVPSEGTNRQVKIRPRYGGAGKE